MTLYNFITCRFEISQVTSDIAFKHPYNFIINPKLTSQPHYNCIYPSNEKFLYTQNKLEECKVIYNEYNINPNIYRLKPSNNSIEYSIFISTINNKLSTDLKIIKSNNLEEFISALGKVFDLTKNEMNEILFKFNKHSNDLEYTNYLVSDGLNIIGCYSLLQLSNNHNILGNVGILPEYRKKGLSKELLKCPQLTSDLPIVVDTSNDVLFNKVLSKCGYNNIGSIYLEPIKLSTDSSTS